MKKEKVGSAEVAVVPVKYGGRNYVLGKIKLCQLVSMKLNLKYRLNEMVMRT